MTPSMTCSRFLPVLFLPCAGIAAPFASSVVSYSNLGAGIYGVPSAVLGPPTRWVKDTIHGGPMQRVAPSIGYSTWNVSPENQPLLCTINPGGQITVEFDPPITNRRGSDFIVFGNALVACSEPIMFGTNPDAAFVISGADYIEPMGVSVSQDGLTWHTFPLTPFQGADGYWPTQAFDASGIPSDFNRPVPSDLAREDLNGLSLRSAIDAFRGSGGGTAFDLSTVRQEAARFIRIDGNGGELDAIARVIDPTLSRKLNP